MSPLRPVRHTTRVVVGLLLTTLFIVGFLQVKPALRLQVDHGAIIRQGDARAKVIWLRAIDTNARFRFWSSRSGLWTIYLENASPKCVVDGAVLHSHTANTLRLLARVPRGRERVISYQMSLPETDADVVLIGASHSGLAVFHELVTEINQINPLCVVHVGSVAGRGAAAEYEIYLRQAAQLTCPVFHVLGKEDTRGGGRRRFERMLGRAHGSVDLGVVQLLYADTSSGTLPEEELDWLARAVDGLGPQNIVFCTHSLPFEATGALRLPPEQAERLAAVLFQAPVVLYCASVSGGPVKGSWGPIPVIGTGGAGAPLPFGGQHRHHAVLIQVKSGVVTTEVVQLPPGAPITQPDLAGGT